MGGATHQGYSDDSCWSRGQAWGIHGFAQAYAYTGEAAFLRASQTLADYALSFLKDNAVPVWDYHLPVSETPYKDSSAGAIMAAGLLLLVSQLESGASYKQDALRILNALIEQCGVFDHPDAEGLLLHGAKFVHEGEVDNMLPYGDYFFLEALLRAQGRAKFYW